jgi:hypothetical protein
MGETGPAGAVDSVAGLTGIITLSSPGGVIGITPNGQDIEFTNTGILSLAGEVGAVTLSSPDASITITPAGGDIALTAVIPAPSISIQAAGTTALTPANALTTYILTSGTVQDFDTTGLGAGDAGKVWYVKNAFSADIDIEENGTAIAGVTDVLHTKRTDTNTPAQILYWSGTVLTMY